MKNLYSSIYLLCVLLSVVGIFSCQRSSDVVLLKGDKEQDSIINSIQSIDSLIELADEYRTLRDLKGELIVRGVLSQRYSERLIFTDAIEEDNRNLVLASDLKDTASMMKVLNRLGENYRRLGILTQAAENHYGALTLSDHWADKKSEVSKRRRTASLLGIGETQLMLKNNGRAETAYREALTAEKSLNNYLGQAVIYARLGSIKEMAGENDSAFWYYDRSLEMNRSAKSKLGISLCYVHFGRLAENKSDYDAAIRYYYRAYDLMKGNDDAWSAMKAALAMARVYLLQNDMRNAHQFVEEGWNTAKQIKSWALMRSASELWSEYEEKLGDSKSALRWHQLSDAYADSMSNEEDRTYVQTLSEKFVRDRNKKAVEALRKDYMKEKASKDAFVWWAVILGTIGLLGIATLIHALYVRMKAQQMMRDLEKMKTEFFTNVTHEFRNPLSVMLGLGRQIINAPHAYDDRERRRIGGIIVRQSEEMLVLVNQLLDVSKAESAVGNEDWRTDNIIPFVKMIVESGEEYARMKNVNFRYDIEEGKLQMDFVPDYIIKILKHLIYNGIKYSGVGGQVTVKMVRVGKKVQFVIADTGRGIPPEILPHIYDPYYVVSNCSVEISTGVGLAMIRQMVLAMKGDIQVDSNLGVGTVFTVLFPIKYGRGNWGSLNAGQHYEVAFDNQSEEDKPIDDELAIAKPTVLVIDENYDASTYLGMQLTEKHRVVYAPGGEEGLEKAMEVMPDIIVTNLMMPKLDGYEVCRKVRESEFLNHIPVIIVSAKNSEADRIKGLQAGADAYLFKPFNANELLAVISNLLESRKLLRRKYSDEMQQGKVKNEGAKPYERDFLNKLTDIVYKQMNQGNIDAESLASAMFMSSSQLRRKLFAITGEKLNAYVLQIRMGNARKLLLARLDLTVGEVATRCGFEDAAYFSKLFKNMYQQTPSQFRRQGAAVDSSSIK